MKKLLCCLIPLVLCSFSAFAGETGFDQVSISCGAVTATGVCASFNIHPADFVHIPSVGNFTWQTIISGGTATSISVTLEGSIDNATWSTLDTSTSTSGETRTISPAAVKFFRCNVGSYSRNGTTLQCQIMPTQAIGGYTLPGATATVLGGVKPDGTSILNSAGVISATAASVGADASGAAAAAQAASLPLAALSGMSAGGVPLAGSSTTIASSTTPGTNQGTYVAGHINTSNGVAGTLTEIQQGDCTGGGASISGTGTYTILYSDLLCTPTHAVGDTTAVTVTIPTPTTLHNTAPKFAWVNLSNQTDTLSPTTFTISKGSATATSTITVEAGYKAVCSLRPDSATIWECDYIPVGLIPLTGLRAQAADTVIQNATGGSAAPTAVAMPTCTSGADLYNTTTHTWSCVSVGGSGALATVSQLSQTAAVTTFTLCAAATCGNGAAHQYEIRYNIWSSGTACATVGGAAVGTQFTWTDENAVTHSAQGSPFWNTAAGAFSTIYIPTTNLATSSGSGSMNISTNGTIIQAATTYGNCGSGTNTYNIRYAVTQLQ